MAPTLALHRQMLQLMLTLAPRWRTPVAATIRSTHSAHSVCPQGNTWH